MGRWRTYQRSHSAAARRTSVQDNGRRIFKAHPVLHYRHSGEGSNPSNAVLDNVSRTHLEI